jgi:ribose/xylose/arabinose/galactoside ABC-type transport system permease subunit
VTATEERGVRAPEVARRRRAALRRGLRSGGPLAGLLATWALFAVLAGTPFTRWSNLELMLLQTAVVGTAAVGATWIIVAGGIDLSVGSTIALGTMTAAWVLRAGGSPLAAAATGVATGALVGAVIGALVVGELVRVGAGVAAALLVALVADGVDPALCTALALAAAAAAWLALGRWTEGRARFRLPLSPFIVTLGLWGALRGLAKGVGANQPIYFDAGATGWLGALMRVGSGPAGLPFGVWVLLGVAALAALALRHTVFGRHAVAVGSSEPAARLCGVRVGRTKLGVYVLGASCAGVAAVLQLSYLSMGDPTTAQGLELRASAAAVIGGASLSGGEGSIAGAVIGALVMTVVDNGCTKLGLDNWVQEVVTGAIIVAAVALDRWRQRAG